MNHVTFSNGAIQMAANLYTPLDFSKGRRYPTIVCVHPGGGVKEQTAGTYCGKLAEHGMVTLAYDASYQGESGGEPRHLEDPYARVADVSAAIDYLTTLEFVDRDQICVLGICAGGGYAINAAMSDRRITAVGTVSAVNFGPMFRAGYEGNRPDPKQAIAFQNMAAEARTAETAGEPVRMMLFQPTKREDVDPSHRDYMDAFEYYRTPRGQHPNAAGMYATRSLAQMVTFDAFHLAEDLLTQPLHLVAGSEAGSLWFSEVIFKQAASRDKKLRIVDGAGHFDMYDRPDCVAVALGDLVPFYQNAGHSTATHAHESFGGGG
jgi:hypothetical protein